LVRHYQRAVVDLIDLFAGCGGLTEGFRQAGYVPRFAVEWDRSAAATYEVNFGAHVVKGDIGSIDASSLPPADVVIGGPPCQGFSMLGSRDPGDPRNELWREFARVVHHVQPRVFVLENVPRFLKTDQFELMKEWRGQGGLLEGYQLTFDVLNAADFGVAQRRRRAVVIGSRVGAPSLPWPTHGDGRGQPWVSLRSALDGVPFEAGPAYLPSRTLDDGTPGPFKGPEIHVSRTPSELSVLRYDAVPPGGNRFDLPTELLSDCWRNKPSGTTDVMGRLEWDRPALTIRTEFFKPEKGRYLHPQWEADDPLRRVNRPITHWEAARIQGFPDDFVWCGSKIEIARQIGNAVPVGLARQIANHLRDEFFRGGDGQ
jgi:DNA (cytosine-5)-methyltransferase 1